MTERNGHAPLLVDLKTAAAFLGLETPSQLRHLVEDKVVPYRKFGGKLYFLPRELEAFVATAPGLSLDQALRNVRDRKVGR